jgi:hypothetical protein
MPNWCFNKVTIKASKDIIARIVQAHDKDNGLFSAFFPVPRTLVKTTCGFYRDKRKQRCLENKQRKNLARFGARTWYDWSVVNWGTKWDVESLGLTVVDENTVSLSFDTAWSPPIEWYRRMERKHSCEIVAYYHESGMCFMGKFAGGDNTEYNYGDLSKDDALEGVPVDVIENTDIDAYIEIAKECAAEEEAQTNPS